LFWECFEAYKDEEPLEFSEVFPTARTGVSPLFDKVVYELSIPNCEQEFVSVYIRMLYNEREIGWFKHEYMLDGEDFDAHFLID